MPSAPGHSAKGPAVNSPASSARTRPLVTGIPLDDELDELLLDEDELELDEDALLDVELLEEELELLELDELEELEITTPDELELELDEDAPLDEEVELDELATTPLELDEELGEAPLELVDDPLELDELELDAEGGGVELPPEFLLLLESHACSSTLAQSKPTLNKVPLEWRTIM